MDLARAVDKCALVGCNPERYPRVATGFCPKCKAGPFHPPCLTKHVRWCPWQPEPKP